MTRKEYLKKKLRKYEKQFDDTPKECVVTRNKILNRSKKLLDQLEELSK